jgi:hypothetical protein
LIAGESSHERLAWPVLLCTLAPPSERCNPHALACGLPPGEGLLTDAQFPTDRGGWRASFDLAQGLGHLRLAQMRLLHAGLRCVGDRQVSPGLTLHMDQLLGSRSACVMVV